MYESMVIREPGSASELREIVDRISPATGSTAFPRAGVTIHRGMSAPVGFRSGPCSLLVLIEGAAEVWTGRGTVLLTSGSHHVGSPGSRCLPVVAGRTRTVGPFVALSILLPSELIRSLDVRTEYTAGPAAEHPRDEPDAIVLDVVRRLIASLNHRDEPALLRLYLQELTFRLLQGPHASTLRLARFGDRDDRLIGRVAEYVDENLAAPIQIAALAERFHLSQSTFNRRFRRATGQSPYQFIADRRMDRARQLLLDRKYSTEAVAREVGYPAPSHFISQFKKRFGCTPSVYARAWSASDSVEGDGQR